MSKKQEVALRDTKPIGILILDIYAVWEPPSLWNFVIATTRD